MHGRDFQLGINIIVQQSRWQHKCRTIQSLELLTDNHVYLYPRAADSLREGLEETLTVHRLKLPRRLRQTHSSTNAMELANSTFMPPSSFSMIRAAIHQGDVLENTWGFNAYYPAKHSGGIAISLGN